MNVSRKRTTNPGPKNRAPYKKPRYNSRASLARQIGAAAPTRLAIEKKAVDVNSAPTIGNGATWSGPFLLNGISQGTGVQQRVGRKTTLKSLMMRWNCGDGASFQRIWRWALVYDREPQGALPVALDIFSLDSINGLNNLDNSDRFMILHDEYPVEKNGYIATFGGGTAGTVNPVNYAGKHYVKFPGNGLECTWSNAATGLIADCHTGALYIMFVTQASASGTMTFNYNARTRFTDL